jgi:uncharacterized protein YodC (DUF2158 family)
MISAKAGFRIGEKVKLNSGSPDLAVIAIDEAEDTATVEWHNGVAMEQMTLPAVCFHAS